MLEGCERTGKVLVSGILRAAAMEYHWCFWSNGSTKTNENPVKWKNLAPEASTGSVFIDQG